MPTSPRSLCHTRTYVISSNTARILPRTAPGNPPAPGSTMAQVVLGACRFLNGQLGPAALLVIPYKTVPTAPPPRCLPRSRHRRRERPELRPCFTRAYLGQRRTRTFRTCSLRPPGRCTPNLSPKKPFFMTLSPLTHGIRPRARLHPSKRSHRG